MNKSGRRLLKAIKKLSTKNRKPKKQQNLSSWLSTVPDLETASLSWSLPSLDTKSIDTYMTYVPENFDECDSRCCYCQECEDNQKNESIEKEMLF